MTLEEENAAEDRIARFLQMEGKENSPVLLREENYASVVAKSQQRSRCSEDASKTNEKAV